MYQHFNKHKRNMHKVGHGRRVGQAANGQAPVELDSSFTVAQQGGITDATLNVFGADEVAMDARQGMEAINTLVQEALPDTETINDIEAQTGLGFSIAEDPASGDRVVAITDQQTGAQVMANLPAAQQVVPPVEQAPLCEFQAQRVRLRRHVSIVNSTPQIVSADVDVCDNLMGFDEEIDRTMQAGPWVPVSGLEAGVNGIANLEVGPNGVVQFANNPNARIANSLTAIQPGSLGQVTQNSNVRVGKKRVGGVHTNVIPTVSTNMNKNSNFGYQALMRYRSK